MKRKHLAQRIAQERSVPLHTAADWLDSFLHGLIEQLKTISGKPSAEDSKRRPAKTSSNSQ